MPCVSITPQKLQSHPLPRSRNLIIHDLTKPNVIRPSLMPNQAKAENYGQMAVLESLARRINMRLDVEISSNCSGQRAYKRLRCASVLCSAPNAEQAELFIQAIHAFAATLNGKWLAPLPEISTELAPNPPAER